MKPGELEDGAARAWLLDYMLRGHDVPKLPMGVVQPRLRLRTNLEDRTVTADDGQRTLAFLPNGRVLERISKRGGAWRSWSGQPLPQVVGGARTDPHRAADAWTQHKVEAQQL